MTAGRHQEPKHLTDLLFERHEEATFLLLGVNCFDVF